VSPQSTFSNNQKKAKNKNNFSINSKYDNKKGIKEKPQEEINIKNTTFYYYDLRMIGRGEILTQVRCKQFKTAKEAHNAMISNGCSISYGQYCSLERGNWPTEKQMNEVCKFFEIEPNCWFLGKCEEGQKHCDILSSMSERMKKLMLAMADTAEKECIKLGIK
jgi:hypothetical protein